MEFLPEAFNSLSAVNQFVVYKLVASETRPGKTDKFPIDYRNGRIANAQDPQIWLDATSAIEAAKRLGVNHGVGFVFTENDPFWFLDIDSCIVPGTNLWSPIAIEMMNMFPLAAIEISSSGKGLHIIATGLAPAHTCKNIELNLEFYTSGRFVALTGTNVRGNSGIDYTAVLPNLIDKYFALKQSNSIIPSWTNEACPDWRGPEDDATLISRALQSRSAQSVFSSKACFRDLWECNEKVLADNYPDRTGGRPYDESAADMALAQHLAFWTGNNCDRILRLMMQSGLRREKWERDSYLQGYTIPNACRLQKEWLCDKPQQKIELPLASTQQTITPTAIDVNGTRFASPQDQKSIFSGCIYVLDEHKILTSDGHLLKPDQFKTRYGGYTFAMDTANQRTTRNAWEAYTESQALRHPQAVSTCFRPDLGFGELINSGGSIIVNTYQPIYTPRKVGDPSYFLEHLNKTIADERDATILLSYMAAIVQHKGKKFQWCPFIQGVEGNGKTLFTRCVAYAIGSRYSHLPTASEITEKYNAWMYKTIFIGVEDIYTSERQDVIETLKPGITNERHEIREMYAPKVMRDICCNFILNSNHKDGILKTKNDRRFAPFYTAQQSAEDLIRDGMNAAYFTRIYGWLDNHDGYAIVNELLHTFAIPDEFNPAMKGIAPRTSSTNEAISHSMGGVEQEIIEAIEQGVSGFRNGWISSMQFDNLLERIKATRRVPPNKRRELLLGLGYDWHPGLLYGRVNNMVAPDGGKPRLFVKEDHYSIKFDSASEIAKAYSNDQNLN